TPSTVTLSVTYNLGHSITMSGQLSGAPNNAFQQIALGGMTVGYTTTNSNGQFSATMMPGGLGVVTARKADGTSNTATFQLPDMPPQLQSFDATEGLGDVWTIEGSATYFRQFDSLMVYFGGTPVSITGRGTSTDSSGHFSFTVSLNHSSSDNGTVTA